MRADAIKEIQAIENKYGLPLFGMALTHVMDVGVRHLDQKNIAAAIAQIEQEDTATAEPGKIRVMTPAFQCAIVRCAGELATFAIWDLFAYIKYHVHIGEDGA